MQRARLRCAHFEELRTGGVGFQECARVAFDNIAESVSQAISLFYSLLVLSIMHRNLALREEKLTRFADNTGG
jgi:hypothetical protein